ncbi:MAG: curli production assembly protein CsgG [Acidobacteriia bacterium]|nr:curli production assembly protein CsgG [Terriglobia bacterium]
MSRATALVLFLTVLTSAEAQQKKRVAVMNFDYATVRTYVNTLFGSDQDVGKGIADILVDRLVTDGFYSVIERKELDKVLGEQNFSNSDRADPSSAAKIGRVLGVDAIIIGSITQFGSDDKKTDIAGGATNRLSKYGIGGLSRSKASAVVQVTARMIDTSTAEILASVQGRGEESKSGTGILGSGGSWAGAGAGALDMRSKNFRETILGAAVNKAVTEVANGLDQKAAALPTRTVEIDGLVADASPDGTLIINVGTRAGIKVGDKLLVKRTGKEIHDPATGKVIRRMEDSLGTLTITEVDAQSAVGKFSGSGQPKVGDTVSNPKQ